MVEEKKYPVCVIVIAQNEAENLKLSLASVSAWVSDIVVVINDCTDNTREVAGSFGARVFEHPWQGFRDQKNIALDYAEKPWVLSLDADEVISEQLKKSIMVFLNENDPAVTGAVFARKTRFLGRWIKHGDWYPDRNLRLFRNGSGRFGGPNIHEKIIIKGHTVNIKGDLLHYSFPDIGIYHRKQLIYTEDFFRRQIEDGKKWSSVQTILRGFWRFFRAYILRLGFLDGFAGFYIAFATAYFTLFRYTQLYEHEQKSLFKKN